MYKLSLQEQMSVGTKLSTSSKQLPNFPIKDCLRSCSSRYSSWGKAPAWPSVEAPTPPSLLPSLPLTAQLALADLGPAESNADLGLSLQAAPEVPQSPLEKLFSKLPRLGRGASRDLDEGSPASSPASAADLRPATSSQLDSPLATRSG